MHSFAASFITCELERWSFTGQSFPYVLHLDVSRPSIPRTFTPIYFLIKSRHCPGTHLAHQQSSSTVYALEIISARHIQPFYLQLEPFASGFQPWYQPRRPRAAVFHYLFPSFLRVPLFSNISLPQPNSNRRSPCDAARTIC